MTASAYDDVDPLSATVLKRFVVKQHHATALHHDVRLEMMKEDTPVLVSWAIPKGLPRRRGERHLAIRTPDHSLAEATTDGTVLDDDYGPARIFDRGSYEVVDRNEERLTFRLYGSRLSGTWHLVHTGVKNGRDQWLAIMSEDHRLPGEVPPPLQPMLAMPGSGPFDAPEWVFEPLWEGTRALLLCDDATRVVSGESDTTHEYPELARVHDQVVALDAILDGMVIGQDQGAATTLVVFDVLSLDGARLLERPWDERRQVLDEMIVPSDRIQLSPVTPADGIALFQAAVGQGLRGVVAKQVSSPYLPGTRSSAWLAITSEG